MPWGIIFGLITVGGGGLSVIHSVRNNGKRDRTRLDPWEKQRKFLVHVNGLVEHFY